MIAFGVSFAEEETLFLQHLPATLASVAYQNAIAMAFLAGPLSYLRAMAGRTRTTRALEAPFTGALTAPFIYCHSVPNLL